MYSRLAPLLAAHMRKARYSPGVYAPLPATTAAYWYALTHAAAGGMLVVKIGPVAAGSDAAVPAHCPAWQGNAVLSVSSYGPHLASAPQQLTSL